MKINTMMTAHRAGLSTRSMVLIAAVLAVAIAGMGFLWFRPGASSQGGGPAAARSNAEPKYTEITSDVVRTARFIDTTIGGDLAAERHAQVDAQEADWASSEFLPATSPISTLIHAWRDSVRDVDGALTPAQETALLTKLAEYVHVRAQTTPDAYFALAEREPNLVWHDPTAPYNDIDPTPFRQKLSWLYEHYGDGRPVDPEADTPKLLRDIWRPMMDTHGQRITEVGVGERGAAIIVMRSRVPWRVTNAGFSDLYASRHGLKLERWDGYATSWARPFRVPVRTSGDVLEERGVALIAAAHVIIRAAISDEHLFVWQLIFFFDPDANEWRCEAMGKTGSKNWQIVF